MRARARVQLPPHARTRAHTHRFELPESLQCGTVNDFFAGLSGRIGTCPRAHVHLHACFRRCCLRCPEVYPPSPSWMCTRGGRPRVAGAAHLNFFEAMRAEHCSRAGSDKEFETLNYRIKRRARAECAPVRPALLSALRVALVGRRALQLLPCDCAGAPTAFALHRVLRVQAQRRGCPEPSSAFRDPACAVAGEGR